MLNFFPPFRIFSLHTSAISSWLSGGVGRLLSHNGHARASGTAHPCCTRGCRMLSLVLTDDIRSCLIYNALHCKHHAQMSKQIKDKLEVAKQTDSVSWFTRYAADTIKNVPRRLRRTGVILNNTGCLCEEEGQKKQIVSFSTWILGKLICQHEGRGEEEFVGVHIRD